MNRRLRYSKNPLAISFCAFVFVIAFSAHCAAAPQKQEPGLLFYLSGSQGFKADYSAGEKPEPNFLRAVKIIPNGAKGPGFECANEQLFSYWAPGNIYAERGTLSFFWKSREPVGKTEFPIFRVAFADHSSWDMVWLRIDYNGHGFDAFVTDANLARVRVSCTISPFPKPESWSHLALAWDETTGIRFYVNGKLLAQKDSVVVLSTGLDQFGPHSRVISSAQVQSAYNFVRGGDIDEIRIYDRMLTNENILRLSKGDDARKVPELVRDLSNLQWPSEWRLRYGWNRDGDAPPYLDQPAIRVKKVEIRDVYDLKRWWWKATDGIRETTWPGVYNRSRLPGRNDYFQLPDWDCYSLSGKSVTFFVPDETCNHLEISGAAWGSMSLVPSGEGAQEKILFQRPKGQEKTFHRLTEPLRGQKIRFTNVDQETPIGELSAYNVDAGKESAGICTVSYLLSSESRGVSEQVQPLMDFINGRYLLDERSTMIAVPASLSQTRQIQSVCSLPIVHVLIPYDSRTGSANAILDSSYAWQNIDGGLDGIAIDLPPMILKPTHGQLVPMNVQVKDPNWPARNMLDFSFSVKPGEARTLWLDTRDRILARGKSLYLTIASAAPDFGPQVLERARIRLIFKSTKDAFREHVQDRFTQVRDNYANWMEERTSDPRLNLYNRLMSDLKDLLSVDPKHYPGQSYWYDLDHSHTKPAFVQTACPEGIPLWAFRQIEDLRYFKRFVMWWIDNRQIENGELGGGLSDDDDLTNCWPGAALMGAEPDKIRNAVLKMLDAIYDQGMFTNGLSTIQTDGLHAHEEGIEAQTQAMLVDYGSPKQLERIMETVKALDERLIQKNKAGHRHFRSSYFSGTKLADESVWEWSLQPQEFLLLQPVLTLAEFNGNARARQLAVDVADGLLAHSRKDENGKIVLDYQVNFSTDASRPSPLGSKGMLASSLGDGATISTSSAGLQLLWAVYRMTGDKKYIQPLLDLGDGVLGFLCPDALDLLNMRETWGKQIVEKTSPAKGPNLYRHIAWQMTGNKAFLENYYAEQVEESALREYVNTEGSLWSDRVSAANRELQRSRLGGVALVRGAIHTGHTVSWRFKAPAKEESMAIIVPKATPSDVRIIAFALDQKPVTVTMTAWDVEPGTWEVVQGIDTNGDEKADTILSKRTVTLERSTSIDLTFDPRKTTVLTLRLLSQSVPYARRPDLGVSKDDVVLRENMIHVRVHSLGSVASPPTKVALVENGKTIAIAPVPEMQAPNDLAPKFADILLPVPPSVNLQNCSIQVDPEKKVNEITLMNNTIDLKGSFFMTTNSQQKKPEDQIGSPPRQPRPEHLAFNVKDPPAIAQWYVDHLGMKIFRSGPPPSNTRFVGDSSGNLMFELVSNPAVPWLDYASFSHMSMHLAFMVDNVKTMRDSLLVAGAEIVEDITSTPSGDQVLMMRDPFGLAIQFVMRVNPMLTPAGIRFEHLALNIPDPQSMTNWYYENLGYKVMRKGGAPNYTTFVSDAGGHMMMELFVNNQYPLLDFAKMNHLSLHFAFTVDDVRSVRTALIAAGATLAEELRETNTGDQVLVLRDPWGFAIQFIKRGAAMLK
ncbi:MAG: VOC family protein [Ignavibacteriales bacterium]|nr:VOC family protein [Ignavibacteriales bacterium]